MQVFCNKIYDNAHEIIGWNPNYYKKNSDMGMEVTVDASDVGTKGGRMSEVEVKMVQVRTCLPPDASRGKDQIIQQHTTQQRQLHGHGQEKITHRKKM